MFSVFGIILRGCLLLTASVVLGVSVSLAKQQGDGPVPPQTGLGAFVGTAGLIVAVLGMAALWINRLNRKSLVYLDALMSAFYLAAAISLTLAMKGVSSCTATDQASRYSRFTNMILNGGCVHPGKDTICPYVTSASGEDLTTARCQMAEADYTFEYGGFVFSLIMVVVGFILHRRGRGGPPNAGSATAFD
ncbi:hypothetical protein ANO14919_053520 [Xylariales sp. No.14919]|nr:hypothetical protein F5X98DRAFT_365100 [Xylaria grammica]GAW15930.1 hypothetical protein ANO14919_053520 [Xylariales sp. No.14919]